MKHSLTALVAVALCAGGAMAVADPVAGTLDVKWNAGSEDCAAHPQPPLQVHRYEPQTFILRQSPCADFEANFLYLLIGSKRALLIDSGAVEDAARMPLAQVVADLLPVVDGARLPLLVAHTHGHGDHYAGDAQLAKLPYAEIVPLDSQKLRDFFGFRDWPRDAVKFDLGDRVVQVLAAPGHQEDHLLFYDERTAVVFSGDFLLPGRLLVDDIGAYRKSAQRVANFLKPRTVTHVLGGHVELDADGHAFPGTAEYHPNERALALGKLDLEALPAALADFNGFYSPHPNFIVVNPIHNLIALVAGVIAALVAFVWLVRALLRRRRLSAK
jgi:hydroxyacylglutathione hydrolase